MSEVEEKGGVDSVAASAEGNAELIGRIGCQVVRGVIGDLEPGVRTTFALEKFEKNDLKAILKALLADQSIREQVDFRIPKKFQQDAPDLAVNWFDGNAGGVRNAQPADGKLIMLTVIGSDDTSTDTLRLIQKVNKGDFFFQLICQVLG